MEKRKEFKTQQKKGYKSLMSNVKLGRNASRDKNTSVINL